MGYHRLLNISILSQFLPMYGTLDEEKNGYVARDQLLYAL